MNRPVSSTKCLTLLSQLLLGNDGSHGPDVPPSGTPTLPHSVATLDLRNLSELWTLATSHHVILRSFPLLSKLIAARSSDSVERIDRAIVKEEERVRHALSFLDRICPALEDAGDVVVIKSLDHWPDLGNDLDLYTNGHATDVVAIMRDRFNARVDKRSWGDRLANKWNFIVPGLPELVEVHVSRLGQTGEQIAITRSLIARSRLAEFGSHSFRVSCPGRSNCHKHLAAHVSALLYPVVRHSRQCEVGGIRGNRLFVFEVSRHFGWSLERTGDLSFHRIRIRPVLSRRRPAFAGSGYRYGTIRQRVGSPEAELPAGAHFPPKRGILCVRMEEVAAEWRVRKHFASEFAPGTGHGCGGGVEVDRKR